MRLVSKHDEDVALSLDPNLSDAEEPYLDLNVEGRTYCDGDDVPATLQYRLDLEDAEALYRRLGEWIDATRRGR